MKKNPWSKEWFAWDNGMTILTLRYSIQDATNKYKINWFVEEEKNSILCLNYCAPKYLRGLGETKINLPPKMGKQDRGQMQLKFQIKEFWKDGGLSAQKK